MTATVTVSGTYLAPDNSTPKTGKVSFRLMTPRADGTANKVFPQALVTETLDNTGSFSAVLIATDGSTLEPTGGTYQVTEQIDGVPSRSYRIEVPAASAGGALNLADVVPSESTETSATYTLLSTFNAHLADTTSVHGIADTSALVLTGDSRLTNSRTPTGSAGGVLAGTYPNPSFASDMATQVELDAVSASIHSPSVTAYTTPGSYSYTPPAWATVLDVEIVLPGNGGASGRRGASGSVRGGGGGGAGGPRSVGSFSVADLTFPVTVTLPSPGLGGASVTTDNTVGNDGGLVLSAASFGSYLQVNPNTAAQAGTSVGGQGGAGGFGQFGSGAGGQGAATSPTTGAAGASAAAAGSGGGGGGAINSSDVAEAGGNGGVTRMNFGLATPAAGGTAGADGADGASVPANTALPGCGGAGGGGGPAKGGDGGDGGLYGGGGGGGAGSLNGNNSGKGGDGAPGIIRITAR